MKQPSILLALFSLLLLAGACMPFRYAEPQPARGRELSVFPEKYWGLYVSEEGDSVAIAADHFSIGASESYKLSDADVVLKKMRKVYVISVKHFVKDEDSEDYLGWEVIPAVFRNDSMFVYFMPAVNDAIKQTTYESIRKLTDVDKMEVKDDSYYLIQDRRKAFKTLWKSGIYGETLGYKKQ